MRQLTLLALAAVSGFAFAQGAPTAFTGVNRLHFIERPGSYEFTGRMVARPLQQEAYQRMGVGSLAAQTQRAAAVAKLHDLLIDHIKEVDVYVIRVPQGSNENATARELMKTGLFEYVEPDWRVYPAFTPNDPSFNSQWSHQNNNSTNAWDICRGNPNVRITLTDTGVHVTHEDLTTYRDPGANSATATNVGQVKTEQANGVAVVKDLNGHGSHTTGIAAATGNNGLGVVGVNEAGTRHQMVRVSDSSGGGSSITALTVAMLWGAQNGAKVTSTSYSGVQSGLVSTTGTTLKTQYNCIACWAAGNDGGFYNSQFDWPDVTIVGSINSANQKSSFSAYGNFIDVMAPGENIFSTYWTSDSINNTYATLSGTSMATPYAAGIAAMIFSENPNYPAQRVEDILYKSAITMNNPTNFGWGRVNLWNAMGRVANNFSLFRGSLVSGGLTDLYRVEGNSLVVGKGLVINASEAPVQVVTEHTLPTTYNNFGEISVEVQASVNASGAMRQKVQLFNFTTGQYDDVANGPLGTTSGFFEATQTSNLSDYMSNGIVRVRTQAYAAGPVSNNSWQVSFDQINVRALRATE